MNTMFIARSLAFYPGFFEDNCQELSDEIILPSHVVNQLMDRFEDGEMLYLNITNTQTNQSCLVAIGSPHTYDKNTIYAPHWILEQIGCSGICDSVIQIAKADMSDIPVATKIVIKPLDPIAFELDTLACFEKAFMNLHSIKEGITMAVPVAELGKEYKLYAYIEKVEPAMVSRIVEGEVDVDFINEFKDTPLSSGPPTGPPPTPAGASPILTPTAAPTNSVIAPIQAAAALSAPELSAEQRRQQVRDSWVKRYQNSESGL